MNMLVFIFYWFSIVDYRGNSRFGKICWRVAEHDNTLFRYDGLNKTIPDGQFLYMFNLIPFYYSLNKITKITLSSDFTRCGLHVPFGSTAVVDSPVAEVTPPDPAK